MPRSRFYKSALSRYDIDELAKIAIRGAPTLAIPAIYDIFLPIASYTKDMTFITHDNFVVGDIQGDTGNVLENALGTAFLEAYDPLQDQILDITSLSSDDPTPRFKGIIRAHDTSTPAFKGTISRHEIRAIFGHNTNKYMEVMNRITSGPMKYINHIYRVRHDAHFDRRHLLEPADCETLSRSFAASLARFDLATAYKNHLGLRYPDCKDASVCIGCPERVRESDPHVSAVGFRKLLSRTENAVFRRILELVCNAELFDDHVARMMSGMSTRMAYHVTYLGMALFQCGLSEKEVKDAMSKCQECKS